MVTNFGNITSLTPRHAENADARLDIRRHDPDHERQGKKEKEPDSGPGFDTYDNAVVSVESLRVFLLNFLQSLIDATGYDASIQISASAPQGINQDPVAGDKNISPRAARAAGAYQTTAQSSTAAQAPAKREDSVSKALLENEEIREIHSLLVDIDVLAARSIQTLTLEQDETFLKSLTAAVRKAKAR